MLFLRFILFVDHLVQRNEAVHGHSGNTILFLVVAMMVPSMMCMLYHVYLCTLNGPKHGVETCHDPMLVLIPGLEVVVHLQLVAVVLYLNVLYMYMCICTLYTHIYVHNYIVCNCMYVEMYVV